MREVRRRWLGRGRAVMVLVVVLSSLAGAFAVADGALAHPPEFVETGGDRLFGIRVCPEGFGVEGLQLAKGRLLCRADGLGRADVFADYSTQRGGMHACPDGTYVRGYDVTGNILVCSFDIGLGVTRFASGDIRSPLKGGRAPQRFGMHVCSQTDFSQVVVAVHASDNTFLCRRLPAAQPTGAIVIPASFDPTRARGLATVFPSTPAHPSVPFSGDISTWRTITLNWLTHILNLPMPGTTGDPRCIRLPESFAQLDPGTFGRASSRRNCERGPDRPISDLSVSPAPPSPGCNRSGKAVAFDKQGFGPDGVRQFLVQYRSPVLPTLKRPIQAYLTLPPGYSPTGSFPAVLVTHGHHDNDKESTGRCLQDSDHANALQLAEHGAITLAPDTITFGDYDTFEGENASCGGNGGPHHEAVCALRIGTMMQRYILDNMVRVSLLRTIPGVDWGRIYTAGLSLGGWQALWTAALDRRVSRVVAAGIFKRLDKMEWQSADDLCQTVPALSTAFLAEGSIPSFVFPQFITQQSMLITTPDVAALIFGHAALLSTWNMKDSGWGQVGSTLADTIQAAGEAGGVYLSEIAPRLVEPGIPNSHEFYNFLPKPGNGPVQFDHTLGAIPFLLGGAPTMITSPRVDQTFQAGALVRFSANVLPSHGDPVDVTWVANHGTIGTGNPLNASLTLGDTLVTAIAKDEVTGATNRAQVPVRVVSSG